MTLKYGYYVRQYPNGLRAIWHKDGYRVPTLVAKFKPASRLSL